MTDEMLFQTELEMLIEGSNADPLSIIRKTLPFGLYQCNFKGKRVVFHNCLFSSDFHITESDIGTGAHFLNCTFQSGKLKLHNISSHALSSTDDVRETIFINNSGVNEISLHNSKLYEGLRINNNVNGNFIKLLVIQNSELTRNGFSCTGSEFGKIDISNSVLGIRFDSCKFSEKLKLSSLEGDYVIFAGNVIESSSLNLWNVILSESLIFNDNNFNGEVNIDAVRAKGLTIANDTFEGKFKIEIEDNTNNKKGNFKTIHIESAKFNKGFLLCGTDKANRETIDNLQLRFTTKSDGELILMSCNITELSASGTLKNGSLILEDIVAEKVSFESFSNYANLQLIEVRGSGNTQSSLTFDTSYLGKAQLYNCNFDTFANVKIEKSNIVEVNVANHQWFSADKIASSFRSLTLDKDPSNRKLGYAKLKDVFRQLKSISDKHGDFSNQLLFKHHEQKAYFKELQFTKNRKLQELITLGTYYSNNFGESWVLPILLITGITIMFYILLTVGLSDKIQFSFSLYTNDVALTWNELKQFS